MPDISDYTVVLSGPVAQKGPLLASLERAGVDLSEPQEHDSHWSRLYGNTDSTVGWVTCRHSDVDEIARPANPKTDDPGGIATRAGWVLRAHWNTPTCGACGGTGGDTTATCRHCNGKRVTNRSAPTPEQLLRADLEQMRAELAALKARG